MEIQLEENPWNCTCDLLPLKAWLDTITVFVGEIVCETPFRLHGKDVTQLTRQDLCPRKSTGDSAQRGSHADTHIPRLSPTLNPALNPTRAPKASRPPKMRNRPTPRVTVSKDRQSFGPIMVYQTKSPVPLTCPSSCVCTSQSSDNGLNVNCQERKFTNISDLQPKPTSPKKLYLTGNYLQTIDLQENPWDCTCDIMGLKDWTEHANSPVIINEVTCESPAKHAGEILKFLGREAICPDGLLVVFILSVCFGAGLFVFVLKRRKGVPSVPRSANNLDVSSFQLQYGSYNTETQDKADGHVYNYIPPPVGQMCQNPIYMQKEGDPVAYYRNLQEFSYSNLEEKKEEPATLAYTISATELLEKQAPREPELLYQNIAERWHSALAWQPFMPKKYFVGAKCSSGCTAGLHGQTNEIILKMPKAQV
ncbi:hypothetical protein Celaphus_00009581 [Cervus elaphus hippelaphus]|uniref:LRRCT domain-containing protein n=1 Tax=Cervus elaphus hippelaphus TaxID=46360 RepID=A0A212BZY1_CEREH|nr:hypothetical protein Celaphus_00009581 [Cervus elaphus hippelaphus]